MWREISKFGRKVVEYGLTGSHFGNISVRAGDSIIITRSGSMLDEINENMVVECHLYQENCFDTIAAQKLLSTGVFTRSILPGCLFTPICCYTFVIGEEDFLTPEGKQIFLRGYP